MGREDERGMAKRPGHIYMNSTKAITQADRSDNNLKRTWAKQCGTHADKDKNNERCEHSDGPLIKESRSDSTSRSQHRTPHLSKRATAHAGGR
jgi:hypothetical protein